MMKRMVGGCVNQVFDEGNVHEPTGHELEIAVSNHVHDIKSNHVRVEHDYACAAGEMGSQQGNRKDGSVHQMLHEGVD